MIARHVSNERDPAARGVAFGRAHAPAVQLTLRVYERLLGELHGLGRAQLERLGARVGERLAAETPALADELAGLAAGAGVAPELLLAVNARTELLAGAGRPECSVIGLSPERAGGSALLAQNWDWHPDLAAARVLWTVHDGDESWFATLTEAGVLGKVGLNSRGLGLCLNILGSARDGGVEGTPVHILLRRVLQECGDVEAVAALLAGVTASASSALNVADRTALASFELSPLGVERIEPVDGVLLHTNHFLGPRARAYDTMRERAPDSVARLDELGERLAATPGPIEPEHVCELLRSHAAQPISVCCHDAGNVRDSDRQQTLASVLLRPGERDFRITDGAPCTAPYETVSLPPSRSGNEGGARW